MGWEKTGVKYLKTGDESGHLCEDCDVPMLINKMGPKGGYPNWFIYCPCCGKKIPTKEVRYGGSTSAYI